MLTALAEEPPASAGYRGSDLVLWREGAKRTWNKAHSTSWIYELRALVGPPSHWVGFVALHHKSSTF